jgi:hypothetical protein
MRRTRLYPLNPGVCECNYECEYAIVYEICVYVYEICDFFCKCQKFTKI